ncbi:MAG TPA: transketolase [Ruminococcaceae bacterium]|mgnify:CR=1 FL=1|jgi:transketolase|nr:transketolase [Oscillospiraceae bacterium]HBG55834.1 transketolase [Oscillospiraceae bacterium]HBT90519.1 transketolase [Oscillospiraceae bacterium]HCB91631.1 transketolase [Oscillospiraceae bacterium]
MAEMVKKATRESYGLALAELGETNPDVVVLDADLASATKSFFFRDKFPDRFVDCGIAECNMIGVAAGLATCGKIPFASSFAMFAAGRAFEQVRNSVGYPHLNVKIAGSHAGISVGEDGATHQCLEDLALMRTIPGMVVLNPADHYEMQAAVKAAAEYVGPVYIRLGRLAVESFNNSDDYHFEIGRGITLRDGRDITVIATGLMVSRAVEAVRELEKEGIDARLINLHTLKPLDREIIVRAARETGKIVTVEEHNVIGGLGDAVCSVVCSECPVPVVKIGVNDQFGHSGPAAALLEQYGLCASHIEEVVRRVLKK